MDPGSDRLSRSRVNRAGEILRRNQLGETVDADVLRQARADVDRFRREWSDPPHPLTVVNMGLRSMVRTVLGGRAEVSQRHKRLHRMIDKLVRYPEMQLARMDDVGGCRVVAGGMHDAARLLDRVRLNWGVRQETLFGQTSRFRVRNYVADPKPDGYRAVHVIVEKHGHLVEVQLRTARQHWWATRVEALEARVGSPLREGRGRADVVEALRVVSDLLARIDRGEVVSASEQSAITERWRALVDEVGLGR